MASLTVSNLVTGTVDAFEPIVRACLAVPGMQVVGGNGLRVMRTAEGQMTVRVETALGSAIEVLAELQERLGFPRTVYTVGALDDVYFQVPEEAVPNANLGHHVTEADTAEDLAATLMRDIGPVLRSTMLTGAHDCDVSHPLGGVACITCPGHPPSSAKVTHVYMFVNPWVGALASDVLQVLKDMWQWSPARFPTSFDSVFFYADSIFSDTLTPLVPAFRIF